MHLPTTGDNAGDKQTCKGDTLVSGVVHQYCIGLQKACVYPPGLSLSSRKD